MFSSLAPSELTSVLVTGSSSGAHEGHLKRLPDHAGTTFVPDHRFSPGETVTVQALLSSPQAGTASGAPGAMQLRFSFRIAIQAAGPAPIRLTAARSRPGPFQSRPQLRPPPVHVGAGPAPGWDDIFLAPRVHGRERSVSQSGLMILNRRGQLVWFRPVLNHFPFNLEVQRYRGRPVLTWWQGTLTPGYGGRGKDVILNNSYRTVAVLHAAYGYSADVHEFQITRRGTALIDAYVPVTADLRRVGGPDNGSVLDCVVQELDIRTGRILWDWHTLGHVPLSASYSRPKRGRVYNPFHLNSIQQLPGRRLLVSARDTWAAYLIDEQTGRVIWTLGGKRSSFRMGPGTNFEWQHDAHLYPGGVLTVFDDAGLPQEESQSSAKVMRINARAHAVSLVHRYRHSPPILASVEGSAQLLADHDLFVGWGSEPDFSEYAPGGRQIFNASFPLEVKNYRAYRFAWRGKPAFPPAVAVRRQGGVTWLFVSWNGASQVASWRVLGGPSRHRLSALEVKARTGFETAIRLRPTVRYVAVQALDADGRAFGRSHISATSA